MFEIITFTFTLFLCAMIWDNGEIDNRTVIFCTIGWILGSLILLVLKG